MAVNKNFVVKNGIEVNENLIVSDIADKFVGIGTSTPNQTLHVFGGIGATDVRVTGVSTFISNIYVGASGTTFSVIDATGSNGQVGIGTDLPAYNLDIRSAVSTGQTALYVQGDARITGDLIADDIVLDQADFTNINVTGFTTTRELVVGYGGSVAGITTFGYLSRAAAGSGGTSLTWNPTVGIATNLQVIGNTYFEGGLKIKNDLDIDTNLFIVGIVTAGTVHVGTALTVAGISTFMSDVNVGGKVQTGLEIAGVTTTASSGGITTTGGDLWVGNNLYLAGTQTIDSDLYIIGIATVGVLTATDAVVSGASTVNGNLTVGGDATVIGDLNVTGDITYDEVSGRNLNITGIATIHTLGVTSTTTTQDLKVGAAATVDGASTLTGHVSLGTTVGAAGSIYFPDWKGINFGDAAEGDLQIYHDATHSRIADVGTGSLIISGSILSFYNQAKNETLAEFTENAGADLYFDDTKRFETTNTGVYITGIATASGLLVSQDSLVSNASTITGVLSVSDTTESTTKDTGAVLIEGGVGIEKNLNLGTTIKMDSTAGVITATIFSGVGEVIGIGSEGTPIGTGVSFIDFRSTSGAAISCQPAVNGIATVTVTPGVSLGLAIALGG